MYKHSGILLLIKKIVLFISMYSGVLNVSGQSTYYVRNGKNITKVENSDPSKMNVTEWQVLLFKKGASHVVGTQWGIITGKTSEQVMSQLKKDQEFELKYNAFFGKGRVQDAVFTNFNPLGPVAVIENKTSNQAGNDKSSKAMLEKLNKVKNVYDQVKEYYDGYHEIVEILNSPKSPTAFDNVGEVFKEYSDNLKEAFQRVNSLQGQLQKGTDISMEQFEKNINEINKNLSVVHKNSNLITQKLDIVRSSKISGSNKGKTSSEEFDKLSEQLTNAFVNIDVNNPESAFKEIKRISKLLAKYIKDDPDSDQKMNNLADLLLKISNTEDDDMMMEYLQKMIELLSDMN